MQPNITHIDDIGDGSYHVTFNFGFLGATLGKLSNDMRIYPMILGKKPA